MSPELVGSRPAIILRSVVFPHPDGPTRTTSDWSGTVNDTSATARTVPYSFVTFLISTCAMSATSARETRPVRPVLAVRAGGLDRRPVTVEIRQEPGDRLLELGPRHDDVDHAVVEQELRPLEARRE